MTANRRDGSSPKEQATHSVSTGTAKVGKCPSHLKNVPGECDRTLIRPNRGSDECELGYWHRVAHENGLRETMWLAQVLGIRSFSQLRVCPTCLQTGSQRWAQSWQTDLLPVCTIHQTWLVDECSACGTRFRFGTSNFLTCACGEPLWKAEDEPVASEVLHAINEAGATPEVLVWLGSIAMFGLSTRPQKRATLRRVSLQRSVFIAGANVVNGWPATFQALLDRDRHRPLAVGVPQLLKEAFPGLGRMIRDLASDYWRRHVRKTLTDYVADSVTSLHPICKPAKGASEFQPSRAKLAQDLKVGRRRLTRLIDTLPPEQLLVRRAGSGRRRMIVRDDHIQMLQQHLNDTISLAEVARLLGVQPDRIKALVVAGELHRNGVAFSRSEVLELSRSLVFRSGPVPEAAKAVSLNEAFKKWVRISDTSPFLAAIRTGDLAAWSKNLPARMGDLVLDASQVLAWSPPKGQMTLDWLSIPKAALALKLKQEVVYGLVRQGWIETEVHDTGRRRSCSISAGELDRFKGRYESLVHAAKRAGVPARRAYDWAVKEGLDFISGPTVDGSRQYFVRTKHQ
jgi:hypothetical protein